MIAADTAVLVAAFASWHEHHGVPRRALNGARLVAHSILETYSVLTRLPPPHRVPAGVAADFLNRVAAAPPLVLDATVAGALPRRLAESGITGGATYDALIAATAVESGAEVVSLDVRATMTYRILGARYRLLA